jgi:hypothetical protein
MLSQQTETIESLQAGQPASGAADVVSMYKREFFDAYGQILTEIVTRRLPAQIYVKSDADFSAIVTNATNEVMKLRSEFHNGADTTEGWLDTLMRLISAANYASGVIHLTSIGLRLSSLIVDGAKIIKKIKMERES